jgi:PST family polysaccharide transporter
LLPEKQGQTRLELSGNKKTIVANAGYLYFIRIADYFLPLITVPYLVRILGAEKFGLLAFIQAFIQYFVILTDYGFASSATRDISIHRADTQKVSAIFSAVMTVKFLLMVVSFLVLCLFILMVEKFRAHAVVYLFAFAAILGHVLFPVWFFLGMEKMKYIAWRNIIAKGIFTVSVFVFIHKPSDYAAVPLLASAGFVVTGAWSLASLLRDFRVRFVFPTVEACREQLRAGWYVFVSGVSINLYTTTNTFILGFFASDAIVGFFAAGEKIIRALVGLFVPFFDVVYPYVSRTASISREKTLGILRKIFRLSMGIQILLFLLIYWFADRVVFLILGRNFAGSVAIVRILSPLVVVIPAAHIFANLTFLPFKLDRYFARIYISGAVLNACLLALFLVVWHRGAAGTALASLITETSLTFLMALVLRKQDLRIAL